MFKQLDIDTLVRHPDAPSRMSQIMTKKLSHGILSVGHCAAVVVRRIDDNRYQILDGHSRVEAQRALGREKIGCDVWNVDDDAARLFVAACDSIKEVSVPELRIHLLLDLLKRFSPVELAAMLPESESQLASLLALDANEEEGGGGNAMPVASHGCLEDEFAENRKESKDVTLTLRMTRSQCATIKAILHDFMQRTKINDMAEALARYLQKGIHAGK